MTSSMVRVVYGGIHDQRNERETEMKENDERPRMTTKSTQLFLREDIYERFKRYAKERDKRSIRNQIEML